MTIAKIYTDFDDFRENGEAGASGIGNKCPGCGQEGYLPLDAKNKGWSWDENRETQCLP